MADDTGSQGDPEGTDNNADGQQDGQQQQGDLGAAGKKALDAERSARKAAEKRMGDLEKELTQLREGSMSEQEKAVEQARREAKAEASKAFNTRLVQAEVRAAAAGKLADPEDAIRFLELNDFDVNDNGEVDGKAISTALDGLLKQKPYLAASATRPTGDADQGARRSSASGPDMDQLLRAAVRGS
jgi:hypothetical protein